jgi:hypothetical protein
VEGPLRSFAAAPRLAVALAEAAQNPEFDLLIKVNTA